MTDGSKPLSDQKRELFAQELARGTGTGEAYVAAGFKKNDGNARRLKADEAVRSRVEWLQARRADRAAEIETKAVAIAAEKLAITKERVMAELAKVGFANMLDYVSIGEDGLPRTNFAAVTRDTASALEEITVTETVERDAGEPSDEPVNVPVRKVKFKLGSKLRALELIGKELGMFINRHEHGKPGDFDHLDDDALLAKLKQEATELGIPLPESVTAH